MRSPVFDKTFYWDKEECKWKVQSIPTPEELGYKLCEDEDGKRYYKFTNINSDYNFHIY